MSNEYTVNLGEKLKNDDLLIVKIAWLHIVWLHLGDRSHMALFK